MRPFTVYNHNMVLECFYVPTARSRKQAIRMKCDQCGNEFTRTVNVRKWLQRDRHYCSNRCCGDASRVGGSIDVKRRKTCLEKYGVESSVARPEIAMKGSLAACTPEAIAKRLASTRRYWETSSDTIVLKRGLTLRRSKGEVELFNRLAQRFNDVISQKHINGWWIDIYIPSHNIYIQFDGVYWHSRPEKIMRDHEQDEWFARNNITLIRITDRAWKEYPDTCVEEVVKQCERRNLSH